MTEFDPTLRTQDARTREQPCDCGARDDGWGSGHSLSFTQRRLAAATPSRWRDAVITDVVANGLVTAVAIDDGTEIVLWNHSDLTEHARPGEPVAVHTVYHVLALGDRWVSVADLTN